MSKYLKTLILLFAFISCNQTVQIKPEPIPFKAFQMYGGIFDTYAMVIISEDIDKCVQFVNAYQGQGRVEKKDFNVRGICIMREGYPTIMWLPKFPQTIEDIGVANHELTHLSHDFLNWANIPLTESSEEVYAYMMQYLSVQFYQQK